VKGRVVAEKRATRSTVKVPFPPWLNTLYMLRQVVHIETIELSVVSETRGGIFEKQQQISRREIT
jgi:hypothetical protein